MKILLANPRGFCAGVDRAVRTVELALEIFSEPVYVRHEVVHNRSVVIELRGKGAHFVEGLDEVPDGSVVIFSAHGIPKNVRVEAERRRLNWIDATCPLVKKVHMEVIQNEKMGLQTFLIGHKGHPEVSGTMGQCKTVVERPMLLIESALQARMVVASNPNKVAVVTQTTLSIDDTKHIIDILQRRFPRLRKTRKDDICYATQNRQNSVKKLTRMCDLILILGSANSSNATRLFEIGKKALVETYMLDDAAAILPEWIRGRESVGISAGASTPERLVVEAVNKIKAMVGDALVEEGDSGKEDVEFQLPMAIRHRGERRVVRFVRSESIA